MRLAKQALIAIALLSSTAVEAKRDRHRDEYREYRVPTGVRITGIKIEGTPFVVDLIGSLFGQPKPQCRPDEEVVLDVRDNYSRSEHYQSRDGHRMRSKRNRREKVFCQATPSERQR